MIIEKERFLDIVFVIKFSDMLLKEFCGAKLPKNPLQTKVEKFKFINFFAFFSLSDELLFLSLFNRVNIIFLNKKEIIIYFIRY